MLSMRLMKKLATLATWLRIAAATPHTFSARRYKRAPPSRTLSCANSSVTLMLIPSLMSCWIAGMPSGVAGIFTMRLGRFTAFHSRRASLMVPSVSLARNGDTSRLT